MNCAPWCAAVREDSIRRRGYRHTLPVLCNLLSGLGRSSGILEWNHTARVNHLQTRTHLGTALCSWAALPYVSSHAIDHSIYYANFAGTWWSQVGQDTYLSGLPLLCSLRRRCHGDYAVTVGDQRWTLRSHNMLSISLLLPSLHSLYRINLLIFHTPAPTQPRLPDDPYEIISSTMPASTTEQAGGSRRMGARDTNGARNSQFLLSSWQQVADMAEDLLSRPTASSMPPVSTLLHAFGRGALAEQAETRMQVSTLLGLSIQRFTDSDAGQSADRDSSQHSLETGIRPCQEARR